jgi:hypothetical protein
MVRYSKEPQIEEGFLNIFHFTPTLNTLEWIIFTFKTNEILTLKN